VNVRVSMTDCGLHPILIRDRVLLNAVQYMYGFKWSFRPRRRRRGRRHQGKRPV